MNVYIEVNADQHRWCVHMDQWHVGFRTPDEAEQFVERLTARLNAPIRWTCSPTARSGTTWRVCMRSMPTRQCHRSGDA